MNTEDQSIDVQRFVRLLRRNLLLIACVVVGITGAVIALSLVLPKVYSAQTSLVVQTGDALGTADAASIQRKLATTVALATTRKVLQGASDRVLGTTVDELETNTTTSVDADANIITIAARADTAEGAAAIANAIARTFVQQRSEQERSLAAGGQQAIQNQITQLRGLTPTGASAVDVQARIAALQNRLTALTVDAATTGQELQVAEPAIVPDGPTSPRPVRNAAIALFASLFLALLVALARDQLSPRISDERELASTLGLQVLAGIPSATRRTRAKTIAAEYENYQSLTASVRLALGPDGQHVIMITSAAHHEGKTTVATRLAQSLARAGVETLLVSGDLRRPRLDTVFDVEGTAGLYDMLLASARDPSVDLPATARELRTVSPGAYGNLSIISAGRIRDDASSVLAGAKLSEVFAAIRALGPRFVIVDAPPVLGVADTQVLAQACDHLLVVARLDRAAAQTMVDLRDRLERMSADPIGLVVIGAKQIDSPYYQRSKSVARAGVQA